MIHSAEKRTERQMSTTGASEKQVNETLYVLHLPLFESLLTQSAINEESFEHRLKTLHYHALLDFYSPTTFKPKPVLESYSEGETGERTYCFAEGELDAPAWRRKLIRKLKAPRPSWTRTHHHLVINREQILSDKKYIEDIAKLLSYKWLNILGYHNEVELAIVREFMDVDALVHFLDYFRLQETSPSGINKFLLRRQINRSYDENEKIKALTTQFQDRINQAGESARQELSSIIGDIIARKITLDDILAGVSESSKFVEQTISWSNSQKEQIIAKLHQIEQLRLTDENFRNAVAENLAGKKIAKRLAREQRPLAQRIAYSVVSNAAILALILAIAFYVEFGLSHITIVDLIVNLLT